MHATLCDTIADIVQNALEAGASRIDLEIDWSPDKVEVTVADNGKGMDAAQLARAWNPFYSEAGKHARRRVGLGLPLLRQTVEATGGALDVRSEPGHGTRVRFSFGARHVDTPPLGDLPATLLGLMAFDGDYELQVTRRDGRGGYAIGRGELIAALGNLQEAANLVLARDFLRAQELDLRQATTAAGPDNAPVDGSEERT